MVAEGKIAVEQVRLADREQQALRDFVGYLRKSIPDQIESVTLFGSKARGDSKQGSDIDILVILSQEDRGLRREILRQAARFSLKYDVLLSPRVIGAARWKEMRGFSLYQNVERDAADLNIGDGELALEPVRDNRRKRTKPNPACTKSGCRPRDSGAIYRLDV